MQHLHLFLSSHCTLTKSATFHFSILVFRVSSKMFLRLFHLRYTRSRIKFVFNNSFKQTEEFTCSVLQPCSPGLHLTRGCLRLSCRGRLLNLLYYHLLPAISVFSALGKGFNSANLHARLQNSVKVIQNIYCSNRKK